MMFWRDIVLKYQQLLPELAALGVPPSGGRRSKTSEPPQGGTPNLIALNWGYEPDHPFAKEAAQFATAKIPFYVCPGTSTWQTIIGKHDNALANLRVAAKAGTKFGAIGFLNTAWGYGGHPQPLAVSWPLFAAGAALAWNSKAMDERSLLAVLSRDVFADPTGKVAAAGFKMGFAHQKLGMKALNETPLGTVIAAPKPEDRELFCRNGLKWFAKIPAKKIQAALKEIQKQRAVSARAKPGSDSVKILAHELGLAARMAEQSCKFMLWQQAVAVGKKSQAKALAQRGVRELRKLEKDFNACWPLRNKATTKHCSPFLQWRIQDYLRGTCQTL
jgi:hypothetical protein